MANTYVNIVSINGSEVLNLTDATASAADIAAGKTAYISTGAKVTGTAEPGGIDGDELAYGGAVVGYAVVGTATVTYGYETVGLASVGLATVG